MILEALSLRNNNRNVDLNMPVHSDIHTTCEKSKDDMSRVVEDIIGMAFNTAKGIHDAVRTYARIKVAHLTAYVLLLFIEENEFTSTNCFLVQVVVIITNF